MAEGTAESAAGSSSDPADRSGEARVPAARSPEPGRGFLPFAVLAVVTFFVTWFVFATITGVPVGIGRPPTSSSPSGTPTTGVVLSINNPFDKVNNGSADNFAPANFSVPAHTLLEFTLLDFDTGQNPVTPAEATVSGTVGNCIYLNSTPNALGTCVHTVPTGFVVHTFSFESAAYAGFNVPIPSAVDSPTGGIGTSVTFFAYFNQTGSYTWNCLAPCDTFSMATSGFMTGTMTVVAS
ncbi:MAG: hypothetical protein L3K13_02035 [Thermoplasmata archaeon]|nr:hypothetical protein [Thermoplasmata archaeon]